MHGRQCVVCAEGPLETFLHLFAQIVDLVISQRRNFRLLRENLSLNDTLLVFRSIRSKQIAGNVQPQAELGWTSFVSLNRWIVLEFLPECCCLFCRHAAESLRCIQEEVKVKPALT